LRERYKELVERVIITIGVMALVIGIYWPINAFTQGRSFYYSLQLPLDRLIPVNGVWELGYILIFPLFYIPIYAIRNIRYLRHIAFSIIPQLLLSYIIFLIFPVRIIRPEVVGHSCWDWALRLNYFLDLPNNCFPSLHVADSVYLSLVIWHVDKIGGLFFLLIALVVSVSTLFVKAHYILDITAGAILGLLSYWVFIRPYKETDGTLFNRGTYLTIFVSTYLVLFLFLYLLYLLNWTPWKI
jgi:membrane-associated phospholipid phosphatase